MNLPKGLKAVRFSFADQHGVLRGKTLSASAAEAAMERGVTVTSTLLLKDTSHKTVFPAFTPGGGVGMPEMQGAADILMIPDPSTFRILPWAPDTGWFLCDLKFPDGRAVPFSTRDVLRKAPEKLASGGYEFVAGLEVEFHVFRIRDPRLQPADAGQPGNPPDVELLTTGYQLLTEQKYDQLDGVVQLLRDGLSALELPLRSFEIEFGPSQLEFTLAPRSGIAAADAMILLRSAVKQIARRHGYHATFMCRPKLPNVMSSGWHLHQSLSRNGLNAFTGPKGRSFRGRQALPCRAAGPRPRRVRVRDADDQRLQALPALLARARPGDLGQGEPRRHARVVGAPRDPDTRIENRIGEPPRIPISTSPRRSIAAWTASSVACRCRRSADTPYEAKADMLPRTLEEALQHLRADKALRHGFGAGFIDYYCRVKEAEIARFNLEVSDWEHREYFDVF